MGGLAEDGEVLAELLNVHDLIFVPRQLGGVSRPSGSVPAGADLHEIVALGLKLQREFSAT